MTDRFIKFYAKIAIECALMSRAQRLKVGSVLVKDNNIISFGWNGTPSGWDNTCETKEYKKDHWVGIDPDTLKHYNELYPLEDQYGRYRLVTKPEVLHAEANSLTKIAASNESAAGSSLFITHAPCIECAKMIYQSKIKEVYFIYTYRSTDGIEFLQKSNIPVTQIESII